MNALRFVNIAVRYLKRWKDENDAPLKGIELTMLIVGNGGAAFVGMASPESGGSFEDEVIVEWRE